MRDGGPLDVLGQWAVDAPLGRGRWMTATGGFLLLQAFPVLIAAESGPPWLASAALLGGTIGAALAGVGLPLAAHARRVRAWRPRFLIALQGLKGWYMDGRIQDEAFDPLAAQLRTATQGAFAEEARRTALDVAFRLGLVAAAWGAALGLATWLAATPGLRPATPLAGWVLAAAGAILSAAAARPRAAAKRAVRDHVALLEATEREILRTSRSPGREP